MIVLNLTQTISAYKKMCFILSRLFNKQVECLILLFSVYIVTKWAIFDSDFLSLFL